MLFLVFRRVILWGGLGLIILAIFAFLGSLWVFRAREANFGENLEARWAALGEEGQPEGENAYELWLEAGDVYQEILRSGVPGVSAPDECCEDQSVAYQALDSLKYGEWGEPLHGYGLIVLGRLEPYFAAMERAAAAERFVRRVEWDGDEPFHEAMMWASASFKRGAGRPGDYLGGALRAAARSGDASEFIRHVELIAARAADQADGRLFIDLLMALSDIGYATYHVELLASEGALTPEVCRRVCEILRPDHAEWERRLRRALEGDRLHTEAYLRDWADRVREPSVFDVWFSVVDGVEIESVEGVDAPLWKERRRDPQRVFKRYMGWYDVGRELYEIPFGGEVRNEFVVRLDRSRPVADQYGFLRIRSAVMRTLTEHHRRRCAILVHAYRHERGHWPLALTEAMDKKQATEPFVGIRYRYEVDLDHGGFKLGFQQDQALYRRVHGTEWSEDSAQRDGSRPERESIEPGWFSSWKQLHDEGVVDLGPSFEG